MSYLLYIRERVVLAIMGTYFEEIPLGRIEVRYDHSMLTRMFCGKDKLWIAFHIRILAEDHYAQSKEDSPE